MSNHRSGLLLLHLHGLSYGLLLRLLWAIVPLRHTGRNGHSLLLLLLLSWHHSCRNRQLLTLLLKSMR